MNILVTGADGLLGSNLVRELLGRKYKVRVFVQPSRTQKSLEGLDVERVEGDLLNAKDVERAAIGCTAIIHAAANTSVWPSRSEYVKNVNINGTRNIINAVKKLKIEKIIYVGTANSFAFGSKSNPGFESGNYKSAIYGLDYMDSKYEAQQLILNEVKNNLPAIIVNPTFMLGPYDSMPSSGKMIVAMYNQKIPGYTVGGRNYVYVKDVAVAIANALTIGKIGECYILGNENLSYKEMFDKMASVLNVPSPKIKISPYLMKSYGAFNNVYALLTRHNPTVSYQLARISCDEHYFSAQKAVVQLQMPQTSIEIAIRDSFEWLKQNGYLN